MVRQDKSKPGRVTPKGTVPKESSSASAPSAANAESPESGSFRSERGSYQAVDGQQSSPIIVPILMFAGLGLGFVMILVNYLVEGFLGTPDNWYLIGGLGLVLGGIIAATQYR